MGEARRPNDPPTANPVAVRCRPYHSVVDCCRRSEYIRPVGMGLVEEFDPSRWLGFIHFPGFTRDWARLDWTTRALRDLEALILEAAPDASPVVRGTAARKIRFAPRGSPRGKSGSYRIGYAYFPEFGQVALIVARQGGE